MCKVMISMLLQVSGPHTNSSAGSRAHIYFDEMTLSSNSMQEYVEKLRKWADEDNHLRIQTGNSNIIGSNALPGFLKRGVELLAHLK